MCALRGLLTTWDNWSARNTLTCAPGRVGTDKVRETLPRGLAEAPEVNPLDALRGTTELMALLMASRWQAMQAAHDVGASWEQIGASEGLDPEQTESECACAADRRMATLPAPADSMNG